MIVIGLTGNYGMGKSSVAAMFRELGALTMDTDEIVRELLKKQDVIEELKVAFGDEIVQGEVVDKKALSDMVFERADLRISLENILHPRVFRVVEKEVDRISGHVGDPAIVIVEAPVIFERGHQNRFDMIITVYTSEDTAIERLEKKGIPGDDVRKRLNSQFPIEMKVGKSDFAIDNSDGPENTRKQVEIIYRKMMSSIGGRN